MLCARVDGLEFPMTIFVEPEATTDGEGLYVVVAELGDKDIEDIIEEYDNQKALFYVDFYKALYRWPEIKDICKDNGIMI